MARIHTHYDNLKVTRNAPAEVIRAAYKTLSQKYHPDRHAGNVDATRVMAIINGSYEILSDPVKRRQHDEWIAEEESSLESINSSNFRPAPPVSQPPKASRESPFGVLVSKTVYLTSHIFNYWIFYLIGGLIVAWLLEEAKPKSRTYSTPYQANSAPLASPPAYTLPPTKSAAPPYVRPVKAPNGASWPLVAGYVNEYKRLHEDGLSTVTVDNSQNSSDVFVKLMSNNGVNAYPVRQFFIPAFSSFTVNNVTAGKYDVRYRDLGNGGLSRSEAFTLQETPTYNGTQFSNLTMTLYKVKNGNMQTYGLTEVEFGQ
ncbi:MAG: J domain-containing protein [Polaromonas sp.]|nr:J domain-containing protein [Polaromonas sp.]